MEKSIPILFVLLGLLAMPISGQGGTNRSPLDEPDKLKGSVMEDVAEVLYELPETYDIPVRALDFSPDGKLLAVQSSDSTINIWDLSSRAIKHALAQPKGANAGMASESLLFSPDGKYLASCHNVAAGKVVARIWRTDTWAVAQDLTDFERGTCNAIGFTPDGKSLIRITSRPALVEGDSFIVYDTATWQKQWGLRTTPYYLETLAISPDSRYAAVGGDVLNPIQMPPGDTRILRYGDPPFPNGYLISVVDLKTHTMVMELRTNIPINYGSRLIWNPAGDRIIVAGGEGLAIHEFPSTHRVANAEPTTVGTRTAIRFTHDGKYLIEGTANDLRTGWGRIWDAGHQRLLQKLPKNVASVAVSRDGKLFATGVYGKTIVWKLK